MFGPREVTWRELVGWLEPPQGVRLFRQVPGGASHRPVDDGEMDATIRAPYFDAFRLQKDATDEACWLWMSWMLAITTVGHYVSLRRGTLDDAAWSRVRRIPAKLGQCTVFSGTVRCTGREWVERFAR